MKPIPIAQYLNQFGRAEPGGATGQRESVLLKPRSSRPPRDIGGGSPRRLNAAGARAWPRRAPKSRPRSAAQRDRQEERDAAERLAWQANEYAQIRRKVRRRDGGIEDELAKGVARILKPLLIEERIKQVTQAFPKISPKYCPGTRRRRSKSPARKRS